MALPLVGLAVLAAGLGAMLRPAVQGRGVPGRFWVPDVADGTPPAVAAIVTTIPKIGGLVAMYRLLSVAIPAEALDWPLLVAVLAAVSMTLGNLAAFFQTTVQRLLAYSTISQVGYLLVAVAVAGRAQLAQSALLFYVAGYAVTNLGAFAVVAELPRARSLEDYRGMARRHPALAVALAVCLFGLIGTPPTAVFVGKLTVFTAAVDGGLAWLAVLAIVNTVASVFYYLRWVGPAFRGTGPEPAVVQPAGTWSAVAAYTCAGLAVLLGVLGGVVLPLLAAPPLT
jgi:NADH-quinone oxidoreductase subunit N